MNRRTVLQFAGVTLFAPGLVLAQTKPPAKMPRVAAIFVTSPPSEFKGPDPINPFDQLRRQDLEGRQAE